jgi:tetratricopeptide (TPR) repeat protein
MPRRRLPIRRLLVWGVGIALLAALLAAGQRLASQRERPATAGPVAPTSDAEETRLRQAVDARPDDPAGRVELGRYLEARKRPFEALWEYAEARRSAPEDPKVPIRLAAALRAGEAVDLVAPLLQEILRARPDDLDVRQALAELYLATAEPASARAVLEARRGLVWNDPSAVLMLGRARYAAGEDAGAVAALERAVALDRGGHRAWHSLGLVHLRAGNYEAARDAFFHAMVADRGRAEYPYYVGMTYLQQNGPGDLKRAISYFKETVALDGNFAPGHYQAGVAMERLGQRRQSLSHYSLALLADGSYAEPNLALGRGLTAAGDARQAHRFLGRYCDLTDRPDRAVREFQAMAASGEGVVPALLESQVYIRVQRSEQAARAVDAALKRYPDDVRLLERLASLKIQLGDRPSARRLLNRWLELNPREATPYWLLGRCDLGDMKYAEGIAHLETAIARDPKSPHAYGFLGAALLRLGTPESRERALQVLQQAVTLAPDDAQYRDFYGQALQRAGRHEEARQQFLKALNADPSRIACYTPVTQLAWRLQRPGPGDLFARLTRSVQHRVTEESMLWPRVWQHPEDDPSRLELARFFCRYGYLDRARHQLDQIVERRPDWAPARQLWERVERSKKAL